MVEEGYRDAADTVIIERAEPAACLNYEKPKPEELSDSSEDPASDSNSM